MQPMNDLVEFIHETLEAKCLQCDRTWNLDEKHNSSLDAAFGAVEDAQIEIADHCNEMAHDVKHVTTHYTKAEFTFGQNYDPMPVPKA